MNDREEMLDEFTGENVVTELPETQTYDLDAFFLDEAALPPAPLPENKTEMDFLATVQANPVEVGLAPMMPGFEHEMEMWNAVDKFEVDIWEPSNRGLILPWANVDMALNGLQTGFHLIGGDSNHGKSGFLSAMECGLIKENPQIFILSFTLDDPFEDKCARITAILGGTTINYIKNPQRVNITNDINDPWFLKWKSAMNQMRKASTHIRISDSVKGTDIEYVEKIIQDTLAIFEKIKADTGIEKKLVVTIDNFHDLTSTNPESKGDENTKYEYLAGHISDMATKYKIPIVCTAELQKLNGHRRPLLDDIRSASKIKYRAKSILLIYNEVSVKGEASSIFYTVQGQSGKKPVFEVAYAKNKYTAFKGRHYFLFQPEYVKFVCANDENERKFNAKIYG